MSTVIIVAFFVSLSDFVWANSYDQPLDNKFIVRYSNVCILELRFSKYSFPLKMIVIFVVMFKIFICIWKNNNFSNKIRWKYIKSAHFSIVTRQRLNVTGDILFRKLTTTSSKRANKIFIYHRILSKMKATIKIYRRKARKHPTLSQHPKRFRDSIGSSPLSIAPRDITVVFLCADFTIIIYIWIQMGPKPSN